MNDLDINRPDPDEILASLINEEQKSKRGKLKIFFGMCAGVGKTYSMLQTSLGDKNKGGDVIIGYIETHERKETAELVRGFETISRKSYRYKSTTVQELDLDAIISRKPQTVLVDELAHTNAPGSRHAKRYQDVLEILGNGINVYTTLNVQHLESRSETVAQITGVIVRETVPDEIFENADEVELVDITPEELLQRLSEGKVYSQERSRQAIDNFFRKGNITALREMSLRIVADRVDNQLHDYMQNKNIRGPWKSTFRLLVAVGPSPYSKRLLRWTKNLSLALYAKLISVYVETNSNLSKSQQQQLDKNIQLARQLGYEFHIVTNTDLVKGIVSFAQKENITHIIVGKPRVRNILSMFKLGNFLKRLVHYSGNIDIYILGGDKPSNNRDVGKLSLPSFTSGFKQYLTVGLMVSFTALICYFIKDILGYQTVSFILLFLVSILAIFFGTGPILLASVLSALFWDYFFIPPQFTFHIGNRLDIFLLIMFFIIALLNGILTSRVRRQEEKIKIREERTSALYLLTKELANVSGIEEVTKKASFYVQKFFNLDCMIFLKDEIGLLSQHPQNKTGSFLNENETSISNWVYKHALKAGKYTDTLPSTNYTFYPLVGINSTIGVIVVNHPKSFTYGEEQFWEACLSQITGKYEREYLREATKKTFIISESEKLYKTLFNSISHELRIPVSTILGATDTLLVHKYPEDTRKKLYKEINTASIRLNRLIDNLLNMSRLESGLISPHPDWCDLNDLANSVIDSLSAELQPFKISVVIPDGMPLVFIDFGLIEQVLHNLLLNATQHSPAGSSIRMKFFYDNGTLTIQVMDRGSGFLTDELSLAFNKFYRGKESKAGGTGLGLSIVKGFVESHKGTVSVENRKNGGTIFTVNIPVKTSGLDPLN